MSNFATEVLLRLAELQKTTAPIDVTIGGVSDAGTVKHNIISVRKAPPKVVKAIVDEFEFVSLTENGLTIWCVDGEPTEKL